MSEVDRAEETARALHKKWLDTESIEDLGEFVIAQHRYGTALRELGRLTHNRKMTDYAEWLLDEGPCDGCPDGRCENCSGGHKVIGTP